MVRPVRLLMRWKHHEEGNHDHDEPGGKGGDLLDAADAHGAVDEHFAVLGQVGLIAEQAGVESLAVHTQVEVVKNALDNLAKGQGDDGQIVTLQTQDRDANEESSQGAEKGGNDHGNEQAKTGRWGQRPEA